MFRDEKERRYIEVLKVEIRELKELIRALQAANNRQGEMMSAILKTKQEMDKIAENIKIAKSIQEKLLMNGD